MDEQNDKDYELLPWIDAEVPISRHPWFRVLFGITMVVSVLWSIHTAGNFPLPKSNVPSGVEEINWIGLTTTAILLVFLERILEREGWFERGIPFLQLRIIFIFVSYLGLSLIGSEEYTDQFLLYAILNGVFITITFEVYSHPLVPEGIEQDLLEKHKTNWWRFTQIFLTASVAILAGIALPIFFNNFRKVIPILKIAVVPLVGILSVFLYIGWKHILTDSIVRNELLNKTESS